MLAILTVALVYPDPPSVIIIFDIVPNPETTAVADAPTFISFDIMFISFWNEKLFVVIVNIILAMYRKGERNEERLFC